MTIDVDDDFTRIADGTETVTLCRVGAAAIELVGILRRQLAAEERAATGSRFTQHDSVWHLPASLADEVGPGDIIEDASGVRWRIVTAALATFNTRWRCVAQRVTLPPDLVERVEIQQASWSRGGAGEQLADWSTLHAAVEAVIEPITARREQSADQLGFIVTHLIRLGESLAVDASHRVVDSRGDCYSIVAYQTSAGEDNLPTLQCVRLGTARS